VRRGDGVERTARAGLFGKGALYAVLGLLAAQVALRGGGDDASQTGAIEAVAEQPFGTVLLALLAVGLTAYALWRLVQVATGAAGPSSLPEPVLRLSFFVRGLGYGALAFLAWRTLLGRGGGSGDGEHERDLTARLLELPFGVPLVVAIGVVIGLVGLYQGKVAVSRSFHQAVDTSTMTSREHRWFDRVGIAGHLARAIVYVLVGGFLVRAALRFDPDEGVGLGETLAELAAAPFGTAMLLAVAVGLVLYGGFCLVQGRYARVHEVT
jgi:hypothetical protein